jgi:hypothetical protein
MTPPALESVELVDEYPGMIRITAHDGSRWHYPRLLKVEQLG